MDEQRVEPEGAESRVDVTSVIANPSEAGDDGPQASLGESADKDNKAKEEKWIPNKNYLRALMSMGIRKSDAVAALYHTNNSSADSAATWLFETADGLNAGQLQQMPPGWKHDALSSPDGSSASSSDDEGGLLAGDLYKMVFVVNSELAMGTGKVGAQVGHAAVGLFRVLMSDEFKYGRMLCAWEDS
ncbi:putative peptidyl-tRNA hydrolase 2-like, partial [Tropilaelaps mercedesae]